MRVQQTSVLFSGNKWLCSSAEHAGFLPYYFEPERGYKDANKKMERRWCPRGGIKAGDPREPLNHDDNGRMITTYRRLSHLGHELGYHGFPAAADAFLRDQEEQLPLVRKLFTVWSEADAKYHDESWHLLRFKEIAEMEMIPAYKARIRKIEQKIYPCKTVTQHQQAPETTSARVAREAREAEDCKDIRRDEEKINVRRIDDAGKRKATQWSATQSGVTKVRIEKDYSQTKRGMAASGTPLSRV